jgi:16S rRNA G1207 methylase RsmC
VVTAFNLFQTPEALANRAAAMLGNVDGLSILEPSAGLGRLYRAVRRASQSAQITLVEQSPDCCRELYRETDGDSFARLVQGDFLTAEIGDRFDRVLMNPPFKQGRDVRHTLHAFSLLKPGGLLVGMCYNGTRQNEKLKPLATSWEVLEPDTFKESGTRASVVLFTMHASQSAQKD